MSRSRMVSVSQLCALGKPQIGCTDEQLIIEAARRESLSTISASKATKGPQLDIIAKVAKSKARAWAKTIARIRVGIRVS